MRFDLDLMVNLEGTGRTMINITKPEDHADALTCPGTYDGKCTERKKTETLSLLGRMWNYMTKEMIITAIRTQHPEMKIRTKDRKLKLMRQWLSTGIEDPFREWKPLQDRFWASYGF